MESMETNTRKKNGKEKLLFVITKSNWGGAQKYVYELATFFARSRKYEVAVAFGGGGILKERLEEAGIRTLSLPSLGRDMNLAFDVKSFFDLVRVFREEQPEIVHLNSPKIGGLGALAGRLAQVPKIIFTVHGWTFRENRPPFQKLLIRLVSWLTVLFSHKTLCVSDYDAVQAREFPLVKNKITVVKNSIEAREILPREEARKVLREILPELPSSLSRENQGENQGTRNPIWIGSIGELHKNKGYSSAIGAIQEIVKQKIDVVLVILGEGEERENLEKQIAHLSLEKHIFLAGNAGMLKNHAGDVLAAFDIFLLPSVKEGLPYVVLEAGLAGLPVIASSVGGIPEIITDMESGILVRPNDAGEIVKALNLFFDRPELAEKFAKKLRAKILKSFSFEKMAKETEKAYEYPAKNVA